MNQLNECQVGRIVYVEKVFHPVFTPLAVVQCKQCDGSKRIPLDTAQRIAQKHQIHSHDQKLIPGEKDQKRQAYAPNAVVNIEISSRQQPRQNFTQEEYADIGQNGYQPQPNLLFLPC